MKNIIFAFIFVFIGCNKSDQTEIIKKEREIKSPSSNPSGKPQPDKFLGFVRSCVKGVLWKKDHFEYELTCSALFKADKYSKLLYGLDYWMLQNCPSKFTVNGEKNKKFIVEVYKPLLFIFYKEEVKNGISIKCNFKTSDQYGEIREK